MASNTKKTKMIRKNKRKPNKENLKKYLSRIKQNAEILRKLEREEKESL